jgi:hypothetical protein
MGPYREWTISQVSEIRKNIDCRLHYKDASWLAKLSINNKSINEL